MSDDSGNKRISYALFGNQPMPAVLPIDDPWWAAQLPPCSYAKPSAHRLAFPVPEQSEGDPFWDATWKALAKRAESAR